MACNESPRESGERDEAVPARAELRPRLKLDDEVLGRLLERRVRLAVWDQIIAPRLRVASSLESLAEVAAGSLERPNLDFDLSRLTVEERERINEYAVREVRHQVWVVLRSRRALPSQVRVRLHRALQEPLREVKTALEELVLHLNQTVRNAKSDLTELLEAWEAWGHPGALAMLAGDARLAALFDSVDGLLAKGTGTSLFDALENLNLCLDGNADDLWEEQLPELREFVIR